MVSCLFVFFGEPVPETSTPLVRKENKRSKKEEENGNEKGKKVPETSMPLARFTHRSAEKKNKNKKKNKKNYPRRPCH